MALFGASHLRSYALSFLRMILEFYSQDPSALFRTWELLSLFSVSTSQVCARPSRLIISFFLFALRGAQTTFNHCSVRPSNVVVPPTQGLTGQTSEVTSSLTTVKRNLKEIHLLSKENLVLFLPISDCSNTMNSFFSVCFFVLFFCLLCLC